MGRSRGELTTKIHALVDAEGRPVRLELTAGQAGDILPGLSPFGMIRRIIPSSATTTAKSCAACRAISVPTMVRSSSQRAVRQWIAAVGAKTAFIEPSSPWDGGGSENSPGDCFPDDGHLRELQLQAPRRAAERGAVQQSRQGGRPSSRADVGAMTPCARTRASATSRPRRPPYHGRLPRPQPWPQSPPCIGFETGHQMGAGHLCFLCGIPGILQRLESPHQGRPLSRRQTRPPLALIGYF